MSLEDLEKVNATFIVLVLKKLGVVEVKDYHPISLVRRMYKVIAKVLASSRLSNVVENIIPIKYLCERYTNS